MHIEIIDSETTFQALLKDNEFLVLDFFSSECPPCEKLAPIYQSFAQSYLEIKFIKAHRQENRALAESLEVMSSPSVLFFKSGKIQAERLSGEITEEDFKQTLIKLGFISETNLDNDKTSQISGERDLCIIGSGPAGLTAAVYAARYVVDQVLVGEMPGGLISSSHLICNYPSENEISGMDLSQKMFEHTQQLAVPHKMSTVTKVERVSQGFLVFLSNKEVIKAKTILVATGTKHRHLGLPNEEKLTGRGISYCATCDGMFYKDKIVTVVGGSDSANTAALYLAQVATKVYQIYRGNALRGEVAWINQIKDNPKIEVLYNTNITALVGEDKLSAVILDQEFAGSNTLATDGLFVEVGSFPDDKLIKQLDLAVDEGGYIKTTASQQTSQVGVWAAGDITTNSNHFRQIITAAAEGSIAAEDIHAHLQKLANNG